MRVMTMAWARMHEGRNASNTRCHSLGIRYEGLQPGRGMSAND